MVKHGQFMIYGGHANPYIISNDDYKVKVTKTWIPATSVWHIEFITQGPVESRHELFLQDSELEHLRRIL